MKIRTGFVSNSSSSSFIIAVKKSDKCPHCGRSDVNFIDLVETIGSRADGYEQTQLRARGVEAVVNRVEKEYFEWCNKDDKEQWQNQFATFFEAEQKGYEVAEVEISYHDEATDALFQALRERKSLVVLWSDHGNADSPHFL